MLAKYLIGTLSQLGLLKISCLTEAVLFYLPLAYFLLNLLSQGAHYLYAELRKRKLLFLFSEIDPRKPAKYMEGHEM